LSFLFIKVFGWGSNGVAFANLISQYAGMLLGVYMLSFYWLKIGKDIQLKNVLQLSSMLVFFRVNKDIFIRTLCLIFVLYFFTTQSANTSDTILAVNTLLFQFFYFFSYFIDGFAYAAEALAGRYFGSDDQAMLKKIVRRLFLWGASITLAFSVIYATLGKSILGLLTNDPATILAAEPYMFWVILLPIITFAAFIWDGIYVGATASRAMRNSMFSITLFIFLPAYYLLFPVMGNNGLWLSMMLFMGARGIILSFMAKTNIFSVSQHK